MTANINDKLKSTWNGASPAATSPASPRTPGATTLACVSLNWPTDTAIDFAYFKKNADGGVNQASVQEGTAIVSGNNLTSIVITSGGADQGNDITDIVVMKPTSKGHQDLVDAVKVAHNQDGSLKDGIVTTTKINDGAATPAKRSGGFYVGTISTATLGTTGNKAITGVGFQPKLVRFHVNAGTDGSSIEIPYGVMAPSGQFTSYNFASSAASLRYSSSSNCISWGTTTTPALRASYVSMDSDGFTINVGTASSTFPVVFEAFA